MEVYYIGLDLHKKIIAYCIKTGGNLRFPLDLLIMEVPLFCLGLIELQQVGSVFPSFGFTRMPSSYSPLTVLIESAKTWSTSKTISSSAFRFVSANCGNDIGSRSRYYHHKENRQTTNFLNNLPATVINMKTKINGVKCGTKRTKTKI